MPLKYRLAAAYILSGFAALVFEVVWTRQLTHVLGATLYAVSASTGLFLGGLAIGSALGGKINFPEKGRFAGVAGGLRMFALLQVLIAMIGGILPLLFSPPAQETIWSTLSINEAHFSTLARIVFCAIAILPVTALMGATFPVLVSVDKQSTGCGAHFLYAANTIGGALGAVACGFFMLPVLGIAGTNSLAAAISMVSWVFVFPPPKNVSKPENVPSPPARSDSSSRNGSGGRKPALAAILAAAFLSGLLVMVAEVDFSRLLNLLLGSSIYSISAVIALTVCGLALSATLAVRYLVPIRHPLIIVAACLTVGAVYVCILLYALPSLPWMFISIFKSMQQLFPTNLFASALSTRLMIGAIVVLPPAIFAGPVLPLLLQAAQAADPDKPSYATAGLMYAANSAGCIVGSFLTGFIFIPMLGHLTNCHSGIMATMIILVTVQIALAVFLFNEFCKSFISDRPTRLLTVGIACAVAAFVVLDIVCCTPPWSAKLMSCGAEFYLPQDIKRVKRSRFEQLMNSGSGGGGNLVFYREGLNSTISVESFDARNVICLKSDGKVEAALPIRPADPAEGSDISTQKALAAVPLSLSNASGQDVMLIGYGTGMTASTALKQPNVHTLTIAELEPAVFECSHLFAGATGDPFNAPRPPDRVNAMVTDGRYVLESSANKYQVIICQPSDPWVNGSTELFSSEFFSLVKSRLSPDGLMCQWVPLYSIDPGTMGALLRTFQGVFTESLLYHDQGAGEVLLVGFASDEGVNRQVPLSPEQTHAKVVDKRGITSMCEELAALTGQNRINTDDNLLVEYAAAKGAMTQESRINDNLDWIEKYAR